MNAGCAECGEEGGVSLKACKSCMQVKYCNAECQRNHWATHKKQCKQRAAELHDEALFKDPPPKEDCPICFLPMPVKLICCVSLPPATISSVPINDFANANEALKCKDMELYYSCCGKSICQGCLYSHHVSGDNNKCPFCNSNAGKTDEESVEEMMRRVEANDAGAMFAMGDNYYHGHLGLQQDHTKAMELYTRSSDLGFSVAHNELGGIYYQMGDMKKAKFHFEAAAMAGHEGARFNVGNFEGKLGNMERAVKHMSIAASAGSYHAMHTLQALFEDGVVSRESIDSTLKAYNNSCVEMRSVARDACIRTYQ